MVVTLGEIKRELNLFLQNLPGFILSEIKNNGIDEILEFDISTHTLIFTINLNDASNDSDEVSINLRINKKEKTHSLPTRNLQENDLLITSMALDEATVNKAGEVIKSTYSLVTYSLDKDSNHNADNAFKAHNASSKSKSFTIRDVLERGICIGCGSCNVATEGKIGVSVNSIGMYTANLSDLKKLSPTLFSRADSVCPFSDSASNEDELGAPNSNKWPMLHEDGIGDYHKLFAGRDNDSQRLIGSSSGGLTSWLLKKLMINKLIDGVIHVGENKSDKRLFDYRVSFSIEDVDKHRKSFYYSTTLTDVIHQIKQHPEKTFAVVGVPCFIKSTRLLAEQDQSLKTSLKYYVGIVCGHMKSSLFSESNAWQAGIEPSELKKVDFRVKKENEKASQYLFSATPKSEKPIQFVQPSKVVGGSWGHAFFQPNACNYCDDIFAETADVAFGDAWLPRYAKDWSGTNVVVSRNEDISNIIQTAMVDDEIFAEDINASDVLKSQAGGLRHRKTGLSVRLKDDLNAGYKIPKKRVLATYDEIPLWRIELIRQRKIMSEMSFKTFNRAKELGDLSKFINPMKNQIGLYKYLDSHKYPEVKVKKKIYDIALFGWHHQGNYGGVLTVFALHEILKLVGFKIVVVWRPSRHIINEGNKLNHEILKKYYTYSKYREADKLHQLRKFCDTFVLASDQLWAGKWLPFNPEYEFLGAGDKSIKKVSVATSMGGGGEKLPYQGEKAAIVTHLLKSIDHVSVREPSAVDILKSVGVKGTQILDPVFLCPISVYENLMSHAEFSFSGEKYITGYILDVDSGLVEFARDIISDILGTKNSYFLTTMQGNKAKAKAIKDWSKFDEITFLADGTFADLVKAIHHSEFVFTDSFHGACLSVIFEKPFICCPKSQRGNSRFALFNQLGLGDRICTRESPNIELITQNIDWNLVRDKLNTMRCDSFSWLSESFGKDFGEIESMLTEIKK